MTVDTKFIWKFPDAISDWLGKGQKQMQILKELQGKSPYVLIQEEFQKISNLRSIETPTNMASIRKIILGYEKVGFIKRDPVLELTEYGSIFSEENDENKKRECIRNSLLGINFWNPTETKMDLSFNINPFRSTLYLLLKLGFLKRKEIGNVVIFIKNQQELDESIEKILEKRRKNEEFPIWKKEDGSLDSDISNPVTHLCSLYCSTDYITKNSDDDLILVENKIPEIRELFSEEIEKISFDDLIKPSTERISYEATVIEEKNLPEIIQDRKEMTYVKNPVYLERANRTHTRITNKLINLLKENDFKGDEIKKTNHIDLFTIKNDNLILCEIKSTTKSNEVSQIRKGISQLFEYEYFDLAYERTKYKISKFLVLENKPSMEEYINFLKFCNIFILWLENDTITGNEESLTEFKKIIS